MKFKGLIIIICRDLRKFCEQFVDDGIIFFFEAFNEETGKDCTEEIFKEWVEAKEMGVYTNIYAFIEKFKEVKNDNVRI